MNKQNLFISRIRPEIRAMSAYHVPDATGFIKLDAMENPYALPDDLKAQLAQRLADVALNRYPVPTYDALARRLRGYAQIPDAFGLMLGNGSDELIHLLSMAISKKDFNNKPKSQMMSIKKMEEISVSPEVRSIEKLEDELVNSDDTLSATAF